MKKIFSFILLSLLAQSVWSQSGEGYDPQNPADPDVYYMLTLEAAPLSGGTVSPNTRQKLSAGQSTYISASPRLGYEFKRWMMGDSLVSTDRSLYFTMPEHDAVLTAYFEWNPEYNPQNPGDPDAEGYSHHVYVYASPSAGGYFNSSSFTLVEGKTTNIYAYPREGYRFESWMCNGEVVSTENPLNIRMGTSDIAYVATFVYNPVSPGEPSPNMFNAATGEVIIDNFKPGSLNSAIYAAVGSSENYDAVQSITVIGRMQSSDFGFARTYCNCSLIDLSRTTGYTEVPSWSFERAEALTKLVLPASVERIGSNAFNGCKNLSELYCYAVTPPEVSENTFNDVETALVIKVPASAVSLYQKANGWKNFNILPVDEETCSMVINLPADASDGRYKNMYIELQNAISLQSYKYLITDRTSYTFASLIRNTSYNIYVKNGVGAILGEKAKVMLGEEDITITFDALLQPQTLTAKVLMPDGTDVTSQASITWLNEDGSLLGNGAKLTGVLEGTNVTYRIVLPQALAMQFGMPDDAAYTVKASGNEITCQLQAFEELSVSGRILDMTTGQPISGATVTVSQLLNGKYTKSVIARSDNEGVFTISVVNVQSSVTISANNYMSQTAEYADFSNGQQLSDMMLKAITGAVISVNFTYTESVEAGQTAETQGAYSDESNVTYNIVNQTKNTSVTDFKVQEGSIILLEEVAEGDVLNITATSKTSKFKDVSVQTVIDSRNRADVTFPVVELGGLKVVVSESENNGIVGILYDSEGVLLRKATFNGDTLTINNLADGSYTLVTMGNSKFFNSVLNLSELTNAGLSEGRDYVAKSVSITSGVVTRLDIASVPTFDESQFYYTAENTSFSANKSQVTIGNYITLRAKVDFKNEYVASVRNLKLVVDLPESCSFVENSVLTGNGMGGYEVAGNRVTVNMNSLDDVVRFCIIPTAGGTCKPSAFVQFNYGGEDILQPIGSAYFNAQNLAISVPTQTADSVLVVNGTAQTDCVVKVYDNNVLVGQTRSLANGRWSARVNLYRPYSHSFHNIYAEVESSNGQTLQTDTRLVEFDKTMTQLKTITMLYNGKTIVFDQIEGTTNTNTYTYVPSVTDFTFIAKFTKNDTTLVKNLEFKVYTSDGTMRKIPGTFSSRHNAWIGESSFSDSNRLPINIAVNYSNILLSANLSDQMGEEQLLMQECYNHIEQTLADKAIVTLLPSDEDMVVCEMTSEGMQGSIQFSIEELDYEQSLALVDAVQFDFIPTDNGYFLRYVEEDGDGIAVTIIDSEERMALKLRILATSNDSRMLAKSSLKRDLIAVLKKEWKNGDLFSDIKGIFDNIADFLDLKKYITRPNFEMWCDLINSYMDTYDKVSASITPLLIERCQDGTLRLTSEQISNFEERRNSIGDMTSKFCDNYYDHLKLYQMKLRNAVICDVLANLATLGAGKVVGKLTGKATSFLLNKLKGRLAYGAQLWLKSILGLSFDITEDNLENIINPFKESCDFEDVGKEIDTWGPEENAKFMEMYDFLRKQILSSYKNCDPEDSEDQEDQGDIPPTQPVSPSIDPSGYVYEGVSSNRLQGVTATAYYMETTEDMYGVLHDEPKVWNAEEYAQENPLFTDENGMYQWDVPQGLWQVKFEKEGYETTYSEWLPVPPPQLEVNIGMVQSRQPEVKQAHAYKDGIEVEFDKYMLPALLNTENILVSQNGEYVEGEVKMLNEETAYNDESVKYASKIHFVPTTPFTASEVTLTVANRVKSYAGLQMQDDYVQTFDVEPRVRLMAVDSLVNIGYGSERTLVVAALPADASKGRQVAVRSLSAMIATVSTDTLTLDENGQAELVVTGELPGATVLNYQVVGTDVQGVTTVNVKEATKLVTIAPRASRVSGTQVYRGTEIRLTSETEGAEIWYTLDGSCPCNTETALKYNPDEPIIIAGDSVTIKAMAKGHDLAESDVSEFSYTLKKTALGYQLPEGWTWVSHNIEEGVPATAFATNAERIVGQTNEMISDPAFGLVGGLPTLLPTESYKLKLSMPTNNRLEGYEFNARDNRVPLQQGWNWIGYPVSQTMTLAEALAFFEAAEGDFIVGQDGFAEYSDGEWQGTLEGMIPGKGYLYKSATATAIPFNTAIVSTAASRMGKRNYLKGSPWAPAKGLYPNVMPLTAELFDKGVKVDAADCLVGAFVGSECRGVGQWQKGRLLMTVYGDQGEDIRFVAVQPSTGLYYDVTEQVTFSPDNAGTWLSPVALTLGDETTAVRQLADGQLSVSPAVAHDHVTVSVGGRDISYLVLTGMNGQTVLSVSNVGKSATIATGQLPDGMYIMTVQAAGQSFYRKLLKSSK